MSEEEIIEENIRKYIKEHSTTIKAYTQKYVDDLQNQLQQKENIIKEVREYIENKEFINYKKNLGNFERMLKHRQDISKILDKGE